MPLYEFHCSNCDTDFELLMKYSDTPHCPTCGGDKVDRLISRVAPPGTSRGIIKAGRAQAAREGHLSNFSRTERGG